MINMYYLYPGFEKWRTDDNGRCRHVPDTSGRDDRIDPITRFPDFISGMWLLRLYEYPEDTKITTLQGGMLELVSAAVFMALCPYASETPQGYRYPCHCWLPAAMAIAGSALQKGVSELLNNRPDNGRRDGLDERHFRVAALCGAAQDNGFKRGMAFFRAVAILPILLPYRYFERPMNRKIKLLLDK